MVAMGMGRFAFTPILPNMQAEAHFSNGLAGLMASLNLLGYLVGALAGGRVPPAWRNAAYRAGVIAAVATLAAMALPLGVAGWTAVRLAAGLASGVMFVLATAFVLENGAATGPTGAALHFAGIGLGITLSGIIVQCDPEWHREWMELAALGVVLAIPAWRLSSHPLLPADHPTRSGANAPRSLIGILTLAYCLEGLGYIVSGTFLVSVLRGLPEAAQLGPLAWVIVGLAAAPSVLMWARLGRRIGPWRALAVAYVVQTVGVALPLAGGAAAALVSAVLYGGTFAGIVSLSLSLAAALEPAVAGRATARITVLYGIGQALGPLLAGLMAGGAAGFALPLAAAAAVLAAAAGLSMVGHALAIKAARVG